MGKTNMRCILGEYLPEGIDLNPGQGLKPRHYIWTTWRPAKPFIDLCEAIGNEIDGIAGVSWSQQTGSTFFIAFEPIAAVTKTDVNKLTTDFFRSLRKKLTKLNPDERAKLVQESDSNIRQAMAVSSTSRKDIYDRD